MGYRNRLGKPTAVLWAFVATLNVAGLALAVGASTAVMLAAAVAIAIAGVVVARTGRGERATAIRPRVCGPLRAVPGSDRR